MVKAIEQIRRDLNILTDKVTIVRQKLDGVYADYLETLGTSIEQQLVLASFQLCTHVYPDNLLTLSYDQRQQMQQDLRLIAKQTHEDLCRILTEPEQLEDEEPEEDILISETIIATDGENVEQELLEVFESIDEAIADTDTDVANQNDPQAKSESTEDDSQRRAELSQLAERIAASISEMMQSEPEAEPIDENSPEALLEEYHQFENRVRKTLRRNSKKANSLFQETGVLPKHIPQKVFDMALQNERPSNSNAKINNLVNLIIEADIGEKKKRRIKVTAIDLKLAELEFGDPQVIAQRSRIREQLAKVKQLKKYYKKTKKDLTIAEAEAAWRSSWHEGELA
ncbi:hypothetical protein Lepto7376_1255 [[Leptolyngbya] sp. PCC 7376]|uniref:hypothetical protein n=1 Tax=[Leptolyngbya] sp. PCC 7376 TaxID=111781 RepID=UPI00029EDBC9|nr:hypothetical protein [[Leptolyngbya] sp. PCC 7376]AFY37610.1 hypothetical protein Lepto7376_1255 [[Leptolyngbya] sp. PCC 7376]